MKKLFTFEDFRPKNLEGRAKKKKAMDDEKRSIINGILNGNEEVIEREKNKIKIEDIDSYDLENVSDILSDDNLQNSIHVREMMLDDPDRLLRSIVLKKILKDDIKHGDFFDWKEENKMEEYLRKKLKMPYKFAYDAYPGGDGWTVIFSKIELPGSDLIFEIED